MNPRDVLGNLSIPAGMEQGIRQPVDMVDPQGNMSQEIMPGASEDAVMKQAEEFADLILQAEREVEAGGPTPSVDAIAEQVMLQDRENSPVAGDVPTVIGGMAAALQIASPELRSLIMERAGNPESFSSLADNPQLVIDQQPPTPLAGLSDFEGMPPQVNSGMEMEPGRPAMSKMDRVSPLRSLMK
jgi:hypothetical protein